MNNEDDVPMEGEAPYTAPRRLKVPTRGDADHPGQKRTAIAGPEQDTVDEARNNEQFYRETGKDIRARSRAVAQDNGHLRAQLIAANESLNKRQQEVEHLHEQIAQSRAHLEQMRYDESGFHQQILDDQEQLGNLLQQVNAAQNQAAEASRNAYGLQQAIHERDTELAQLRAQVYKQDDEVNHLRLRLKAAARTKAEGTPRRRGRVNNELFATQQPSTVALKLALDPIPHPTGNPTPLPADGPAIPAALADHPVVKRMAEKINMDVEEVTEFMGLLQLTKETDAQVIVTPPKKSSRKAKPKDAIKKSAQPATKDLVNAAHAMTRKATFRLFKVEIGTDFIFHEPATEKEVEDFAADDDATLKHWQWDFNPGYLTSAWNAVQIERVVAAAVKDDEKADRYVSKGQIKREFLEIILAEQLERWRGDWKLFQPRWWEAKGRIETKHEAVARGKLMLYMRRMNSKNINAQNRKYLYRRTTLEAVIALKEAENADDLPTWIRLLELLDYLEGEGMSEEEEKPCMIKGQKIKTFKIKLCVWREASVAKYMNIVDAQKRRFEELHNGTKSAPRERTEEIGRRPAPKGLPRSLYDSKWLASQSPKQLMELEVSEDVFALFVAATDRMAM
ncbi:hypothetical protein R3P38DRAFT_3456314 [Favolaschia claudopus]|uniref:Uncharacterized protein n=1 Tax=Favolaschia claudopus TaxID=2862362 RepID=A0AAV9ZI03_9AGAR